MCLIPIFSLMQVWILFKYNDVWGLCTMSFCLKLGPWTNHWNLFYLRQLWDINMDSGPVSTFQVHEYLRPKVSLLSSERSYTEQLLHYSLHANFTLCFFPSLQLCDLYENDSIFDKFECCLSGDGMRVATGSYRSVFKIFFIHHCFLNPLPWVLT